MMTSQSSLYIHVGRAIENCPFQPKTQKFAVKPTITILSWYIAFNMALISLILYFANIETEIKLQKDTIYN